MNYNADYDECLNQGEIGQARLREIFADETIEVKRDFKSHKSGNVYVEFESRGKPSGIAISKALHYAFILENEHVTILIETIKLKRLCVGAPIAPGGDSDTSRGYLIKKTDLVI